MIIQGHAVDVLTTWDKPLDLLATDPPYAFGGDGTEHALAASVAVTLRESAKHLKPGSWALVMAASSWRSTYYMVEAMRGVLDPVRIATWNKPAARSKTRTAGWAWSSVNVIAFRKGTSRKDLPSSALLDHITQEPIRNGRRAELPPSVADWVVGPFAVAGGTFLDPFAGSGALVDAAKRAEMDAHGIEIDP